MSTARKWLYRAAPARVRRPGDIIRRIQEGDARLESTLAAVIAIAASGYGIWTAVWGLGGAIGWWLVPVSAVSLILALRAIHAKPGSRTGGG